MIRYVALLRGVSPINLKMPALKKCFDDLGFTDVKTVLASGNVLFSGRSLKEATLEKRCEEALEAATGHHFMTFVRPVEALQLLLESDPFAGHRVPANAKRVVTFFRDPPDPRPKLPVEQDGAKIYALKAGKRGCEAFSAYVVSPKGPVFMSLIEKTFGKDVTTRTWGTVEKLAR